ncbi:MAG TPA: hypothetical protein VGS19_02070 [Streptosporangiaceae bacterium]|nr:hypothetical protein [Streptosporangiaceae bacterium]
MQSWLPYITGSGGALAVMAAGLYLFLAGKLHSDREFSKAETDSARKDEVIERLQEALALERQRSNDVAQAGAVTNQLIGALTTLAAEHRDAAGSPGVRAVLPAVPLDLTGKDAGL